MDSKNVFVSWILQTYLRLKAIHFSCQLVDKLPEEGIIVGYRYSFPYTSKPSDKSLWVCVKGDQNPHPYAQLCVVQNKKEVDLWDFKIQLLQEDRYLLPCKRFFMPHWPQPNIISRNPERKEIFENIAFFGVSYNLASELKSQKWKNTLVEKNLQWIVEQDRCAWNDYSYVDAIVAVRNFNSKDDYSWKPASKLYNAKDLPPYSTVYWHYKNWKKEGIFEMVMCELHKQLREKVKKNPLGLD
ncbi:hypothetical protein AA637_11415 [Cyanobacterium sp. HL-69]|uniref:hypothetical protein n=1 Tax=Cyanobacterium sp. HL-69 TaxID=2054282 RepID=UPI000CA37DF9|nr:hypothetical protein AA637_11415 [Cyanobacterium sp. HL-69]